MSTSISLRFDSNAACRSMIQNVETMAVTSALLVRFGMKLGALTGAGVAYLAQREYEQVQKLYEQAKAEKSQNVAHARELSRQLGHSISQLSMTVQTRQQEENLRQRQKERQQFQQEKRRKTLERRQLHVRQREFIESILQRIHAAISDPVALETVRDEVQTLESLYADLAVQSQIPTLQKLDQDFCQTVEDLRIIAQDRAFQRRKQEEEQVRRTVMMESLETQKAVLTSLTTEGTKQEFDVELQKIAKLQERILRNETISEAEWQEALNAAQEAAEKIRTNEAVRREALKAIIGSLQQVGFLIEQPLLRGEVVELPAKRPSGERCTFYVDIKGGLEYHFHNYEGNACKKDIGKVLPLLQNVYGIRLSDERVLWSNPDRNDHEARWNSLPEHHDRTERSHDF